MRLKCKDAESSGFVVISEGPETVAEAAHALVVQFASLVQDVREDAEEAAAEGLTDRGNTVHEACMEFIARRKANPRPLLGVPSDQLDGSPHPFRACPGTGHQERGTAR